MPRDNTLKNISNKNKNYELTFYTGFGKSELENVSEENGVVFHNIEDIGRQNSTNKAKMIKIICFSRDTRRVGKL